MVLLLLLFGFGVTRLFFLRFETGDVYPAYSSLRSDPLGTRALFESLANLDSVAVSRNYLKPESIKFEPRTTFFYLGASAGDFASVPEAMLKVFDGLIRSGGRLVITFLPVTNSPKEEVPVKPRDKQDAGQPKTGSRKKSPSVPEPKGDKKASAAGSEKKSESSGVNGRRQSKEGQFGRMISIKKHWGLETAFKNLLPVQDDKTQAIEAASSLKGLPPSISWHSNLYFKLYDDAWRTLYSYDGLPLIVEKSLGNGSIVLCADSYFLSNEALLAERHPRLLVWLIGGHANLVFDEAHHGLYRQPSVAQLVRHFQFHWFFAVLAALALLFVWKSAVYFIPPAPDDDRNGADVVSEKDYTQGLIALLRRNLPSNQLLRVCAREWEQTFKKNRRIDAVVFKRIRSIAGAGSIDSKPGKDPVNEYRKISREIKRSGIYSRNRNIF